MRWRADLRRWFTRFYARQVSERTPGGGRRASLALAVNLPIAPGQRADLIRFATMDDTPVMRATWVAGQRV